MIYLIWVVPLIITPIVFVVYMLRKEHKERKKMFDEIRKRKTTIKF